MPQGILGTLRQAFLQDGAEAFYQATAFILTDVEHVALETSHGRLCSQPPRRISAPGISQRQTAEARSNHQTPLSHPFCQHGTIMTCVKSALLLSFCRNDTLWGTFVANNVVAKSYGVYQNRCHPSALIVPRGLRNSASSPSSIVECRRHITNEPSLPCRRDPEATSKQLRYALVATAYGMFFSARTYDSSFREGFG